MNDDYCEFDDIDGPGDESPEDEYDPRDDDVCHLMWSPDWM